MAHEICNSYNATENISLAFHVVCICISTTTLFAKDEVLMLIYVSVDKRIKHMLFYFCNYFLRYNSHKIYCLKMKIQWFLVFHNVVQLTPASLF